MIKLSILKVFYIIVLAILIGEFARGSEVDHLPENFSFYGIELIPFSSRNNARKSERLKWIGKYEISQMVWKQVLASQYSNYRDPYSQDTELINFGSDYPVSLVSFLASVFFCEMATIKLHKKYHQLKNLRFRLPSVEEWEQGAIGPINGEFGVPASDINVSETIWPVFKGKPLRSGVVNPHGNVAEWCDQWKFPGKGIDAFGFYNEIALKGGGIRCPIDSCKKSATGYCSCTGYSFDTGFRVILSSDDSIKGAPSRSKELLLHPDSRSDILYFTFIFYRMGYLKELESTIASRWGTNLNAILGKKEIDQIRRDFYLLCLWRAATICDPILQLRRNMPISVVQSWATRQIIFSTLHSRYYFVF